MLEAVTLTGSAARISEEIDELRDLAGEAKAVEDLGGEAKLSRLKSIMRDEGFFDRSGPAAVAVHRVQGHARLPDGTIESLGFQRRLYPRWNEARIARRAG